MRNCQILSCNFPIPDRKFVCAHHWRRLPHGLRQDITDWLRLYTQEIITLEQLRRLTTIALADFQCVAVEELEEMAGGVTAAVTLCRYCGKTLIAGHEQDEKGGTVIIGGVAKPAQGKPAIYTRFSMHGCSGLKHALRNVRCSSERTS